MRMLIMICAIWLYGFMAAPVPMEPVRQIKIEANLVEENIKNPKIITSAAEAEKVYGKGALKEGQVDFDAEKIICFGWIGSGGDEMMAKMESGEVVVTLYPGIQRDLRGHTKSFVVPKNAKWRLERKFIR